MSWVQDRNRIDVFAESRKRRQFVGTLSRDPASGRFHFEYDRDYLRSKRAISLGPELNLSRPFYESEPGNLFPSFADRIPSRNNPAYAEYCASAGISAEETDPMAILPAIARRGPSTFIFEAVWKETADLLEKLQKFRAETGLSFYDLAQLTHIPLLSLKRFEAGLMKRDTALTELLRILLDHPDVLLERVRLRGSKLHDETRRRLETYLQKEK